MDAFKKDYYFEDIAAFPFGEILEDIHLIAEYFKKKKDVLKKIKREIKGEVAEHVILKGEIYIGEGTVIEPFVTIEGPVYIGKNVLVRSGALIRSNSIIGDDAVIGHGAEIKNTHAAAGAKIQSITFVGDSILGKGARVGSGTIVSNRRFDQAEVKLKIGEKVIATGTDKFGVIMGDYVRLGTNVSTSPGTVIGKNTWVYGNAAISGFIPKDSLVKLRQTQEIVEKQGETVLKQEDMEGRV